MLFVYFTDKIYKNYLDLQSKLNSEESKYPSVLELRKDVLRGNFFNGDKAVWMSPKFKLCCYISSTTSDTHLERDIIINELLFSLREIAKPHGIHRPSLKFNCK